MAADTDGCRVGAARVGAERMLIGFKIAEHLTGNLRAIQKTFGAVSELIEGQAEPLAMPPDDPHQRHVFRQPVPALHRRIIPKP